MSRPWETDNTDGAAYGDALGGPSGAHDAEDVTGELNDSSGSVRSILSSLFLMQRAGGPDARGGLTLRELTRLLSTPAETEQVPSLSFQDDGDEEDEHMSEDDDEDYSFRSTFDSTRRYFKEVTEPQEPGVSLLKGGDFGRVAPKIRARRGRTNVARYIHNRTSQPHARNFREDCTTNLVPNTHGTAVSAHEANIYTGQYSGDSSFYYTCSQDFKLHVFDTTAPRQAATYRTDTGLRTTMKVIKTITGTPGRWTITDANLSSDNQRMIYASITPTVYMASTLDSNPVQTPISFADPPRAGRNTWGGHYDSFGIWSCRFSADGNEVVAGGSGSIFVYDLLANRRTVRISAHADDVNSCCWADTASGNVLVSASDDTFLKVWDRRSLGATPQPSGVLIGHTEGITYVSAKGDGRYVISNGKDQALRLWDLRMMRSNADYQGVRRQNYGARNFDYRYPHYPQPRYMAHPMDCSVMTYRGHAVLRTLIRCHFSPAETTGSQYIYSGSADGRIHIWSLDGQVVQILDRAKATSMAIDPSGPEPERGGANQYEVCVRDVSWHSQEPVLMSAGWESGRGGSLVARHEWKGLSKMKKLEDWVSKAQQEKSEEPKRNQNQTTSRNLLSVYLTDEEDEDE
ncbi:WD40 repeat-like protein [Pluteus cervinus]|uniref:WD40 repeat-like protein n=1 Tax=Pluteus cervinus TaxID=181527 RepID=A0ACD3BHU7_9AGAR|nr:WD40 repeat-like protein [Pluteus cervinus]